MQILLLILAAATAEDWPGKAATEFTRAYLQLDPAMADRLCQAHSTEADIYAMDDARQKALEEANARGLGFKTMTSMIYHVKTKTEYISETEAHVRLTGKKRMSINPVYFLVSVIFNIGEVRAVDETLSVVKEGDQWKVCERFSDAFENI